MPNIPAGFVEAVGPDGQKRVVPQHYLENKAMGDWKLTARGKKIADADAEAQAKAEAEAAQKATVTRRRVTEPAEDTTTEKEAGR